jgi:uncharacterized protein YdeI (YjbR/CyaY-like superfamily)
MPSVRVPKAPVFFESSAAFRRWLERHGDHEAELVVGYYKVGTGRPSLTWSESVDEALCFGWIDGVRRSIDEFSYQIRFTPRTKRSVWSAVNTAKVDALTAAGRMHPAGLDAYARRLERTSGIYSYEQRGELKLSADEARTFKKDKAAWRFFEATPPGYRKTILYWLVSAKQASTRARRFAELVAACAGGQRLFK